MSVKDEKIPKSFLGIKGRKDVFECLFYPFLIEKGDLGIGVGAGLHLANF